MNTTTNTTDVLLSKILNEIEDTDINEKQVSELRYKMKQIEKKLKTKLKPKTITISSSDHDIIKTYCSYLKLNIGDWVSKTLLKEINENSCAIYEEGTEEEILTKRKNELTNNFFDSIRIKSPIIKTNKIIVGIGFKFLGYSIIDAMPIYEITPNMPFSSIPTKLDDAGVKFEVANVGQVSLNIFSNQELDVEVIY